MATVTPKSYTSIQNSLFDKVREIRQLMHRHGGDISGRADHVIARIKQTEQSIERLLGRPVANCDMLDVGPGQNSGYMRFFSREQVSQNRVTGIDIDYPLQTLWPWHVAKALKVNGTMRVAKTVGRKLMGVDSKYLAAFEKRLGAKLPRTLNIKVMDATKMSFADASFDVVYSHSVFEHIIEVRQALSEVKRVLKPGGVAFIAIHLWTADDGSHDPGILSGERRGLPGWPHLREKFAHQVKPNAVVNKLRLADYRKLAGEVFGEFQESIERYNVADNQKMLDEARSLGELTDYTDEELLAVDLTLMYRK
jgi:SAM-dependent methyltransferase